MTKVLYTLNASCRHPSQYFAIRQSKVPHFDLMSSITSGITTSSYTAVLFDISNGGFCPCLYLFLNIWVHNLCKNQRLEFNVTSYLRRRYHQKIFWYALVRHLVLSYLSFTQIMFLKVYKQIREKGGQLAEKSWINK